VRLAARAGTDLTGLRGAIAARLDGIVSEMSHWAADSLLSGYNRSEAGSWTALPADFAAVIEASLIIAQKSGGAFDPSVGQLTDLYGLAARPALAEPTTAQIDEALAISGWQKLTYDDEALRLQQPGGLWLDFSGVAKGYAVDAVADLLDDRSVNHCMVEIGGECLGRGIRPDTDPWWVDLETPPGIDVAPMRVALHQLAVATSGNYVRGDHTLDPRTGLRVVNGIASASVLHRSTMLADAWATALTVLGPEEGAEMARNEGLAARLLFLRDRGPVEWISPALERMLDEV
jgi:thiamine biosynthesis lipoprotein